MYTEVKRPVPIVGMLCGNTISKLQVSLAYVLDELSVNRGKTEAYLGFGASRIEACKPVAKAALRLALAPSINQMRFVQSSKLQMDHV